ncbi:MAG: hypothetical protein IPI66_10815 [Chitinophagaceae bacterium]|nr:hypothetical protein [Chitinophagaceae bacterium]
MINGLSLEIQYLPVNRRSSPPYYPEIITSLSSGNHHLPVIRRSSPPCHPEIITSLSSGDHHFPVILSLSKDRYVILPNEQGFDMLSLTTLRQAQPDNPSTSSG